MKLLRTQYRAAQTLFDPETRNESASPLEEAALTTALSR